MRFLTTLMSIAAITGLATAILDPATSYTKGYYPAHPGCSAQVVSKAIQAAECSHNTRVNGQQTFAVFKTDNQYATSHGAPYGDCWAYICTAPLNGELTELEGSWTFFWGPEKLGANTGYGTSCIKSPVDGTCGCERSKDGKFMYASNRCV
ncbi:hypothetical protein NHQ30_005188 [Ciborinia camelliae]|nr:hypothetical protein NHQ30_005188 [Ciborinia camelliae]